jgi:WhiB family redox-sensing transcriptional regulator
MSLTINAWREHRACIGVATENFFPRTRGIAKYTIEICDKCPVKWDCLNYSIINGIEHGIWGGKTEGERIRIIRAYQKLAGRPEPEPVL